MNLEIRAQFLQETHRWDETALVTCRQEDGAILKLKVRAAAEDLVAGLTYSFFGRWQNHFKYGRQFVAQTFTKVTPHDEKGIIAYLLKAPNVGPKIAARLWELFKGEAVRQLREAPAEVAQKVSSKQFTAARAQEAATFLEQEKNLEDATIRVVNLLSGKGFPRDIAKDCIRTWGNVAADMIDKNPFNLMRFKGCGFGRCDELYLELGGRPAALKRQALCIWYAISRDMSGSTWFDTDFVTRVLQERIGSAEILPVAACKLGKRSGLLAVHRPGVGAPPWITERGRSTAEQDIADRLAIYLLRKPAWPELEGLDVSDHQRERLAQALRAPIGILSGSPGTGKTYAAAHLIAKLIEIHGADKVAVVAPTGKAAVRISEALDSYGIGIRARTIHSFLGVVTADDQGFSFSHNEENPIDERFLVCDEASMVDTQLFSCLLSAMRDDGHLLLVGDLQQLPPVGHGAPLRDLLAAGVPSGELREIRRSSGLIVETCARIRDEELFDLPRVLDLDQGVNLKLQEARHAEIAVEEILGVVRRLKDHPEADAVWGAQVIVAVNEKSPLSRKALNGLLQAELNGHNRGDGTFWPNDKVVCLKNTFLPAVEEAMEEIDEDEEGFVRTKENGGVELYVANGELGRVIKEFPNRLILEFSSPRRVVLVPRGEKEIPFDLGYAISAHKSQGSEWPVVIVALDDSGGARQVCDRSWLYTSISRAKKACILVGQEETARSMCRRQKLHHRKTFLVERLAESLRVFGGEGGSDALEDREPAGEPAAATEDLGGAADGSLCGPVGRQGESALSV